MDQRPPVAPIRAITSNLHARSPPSVPRANATYEPQIRNVLRLRLVREIMPRAIACVWMIESFWAYLNLPTARRQGFLGLLAIPFRPTTLAMTFVTWMFVVVPVLLSRRDGLSATPTPAASPAQLIKTAYARPVTRARLVLYLVAGFSFFLMQQAAANLCRPTEEIYLNVFVKSKKHPLYFNGRFLYTFFSQIFLGGVFFARNVLLDRWVVKWKVSPGRGAQRTVAVAIASLFIAVLSLSAFTLLFGLTRALVLPILLNFPIVRSVFRPFAAHFIRGRWTLFLILSPKNIAHVLRTFVINLSFAFALEFAEALFDEHVARPIALAPSSADPGVTLVSGATSPNSFYKYFAMHELRDFASDPAEGISAARMALFGDQKHNPTLWATFVRDALMVLGADYQLLLRRGKPASPPVLPAPLPAPEKAKLPEIPATPLQRGKIFKSTTQSPVNAALDALAADGAITQAVETSAERLPAVFQATHVPLLANSRPALPAPSAIVPVPSLSPGAGVGGMVMRRMPGSVRDGIERVREWWTAERLSRVAERSLPNRELDALTIDTLSYFICASLTEDRYGVVQRDIPRALEALVSFLTALETYHAELLAAMPPSPDEPGLSTAERASRAYRVEEISKARDVLMVVEDALKNGIMRIVQTFGARMAAFKFPSRTAEKLQEFVSYVQLSGHEDGKYAPGVALQVEAW